MSADGKFFQAKKVALLGQRTVKERLNASVVYATRKVKGT
jgi:hypothetical protein